MSSYEIKGSILNRIGVVLGLVILAYVWFTQLTFESPLVIALALVVTPLFLIPGLTNLAFLMRGNPAVVTLTGDVVTVSNGITKKVFDRTSLRVSRLRGGYWPRSITLRDGTKKTTITAHSTISEEQFAALNVMLWN